MIFYPHVFSKDCPRNYASVANDSFFVIKSVIHKLLEWIKGDIRGLMIDGCLIFCLTLFMCTMMSLFKTSVAKFVYNHKNKSGKNAKLLKREKHLFQNKQPANYAEDFNNVCRLSMKSDAQSTAECIELLSNIKVVDCINLYTPSRKYTPFLRACWAGNLELIKYMVAHGADIASRLMTGESGLFLAIYRVVKYGESSESGRLTKNENALLDFLFKVGCDVNTPNVYGITPLHYAVKEGHVASVRWLLDHGADIYARISRNDLEPMAVSALYNDESHREIARELQQHEENLAKYGFSVDAKLLQRKARERACADEEGNAGPVHDALRALQTAEK